MNIRKMVDGLNKNDDIPDEMAQMDPFDPTMAALSTDPVATRLLT